MNDGYMVYSYCWYRHLMIKFACTRYCLVEGIDNSVSSDGKEITMQIGVSNSMGYIRKVAVNQQDGGVLYLDCYSAFGGLNGSIGAIDKYTIQLEEDTNVIALYRGANTYEIILEKDIEGNWKRVER